MVKPVAMFARQLNCSEAKEGPLQQFMSTVHWVMRTAWRYTMFVPHIVVLVEEPERLLVLKQAMAIKLRAKLVELSMYPIEWRKGIPSFADLACTEPLQNTADTKMQNQALKVP